MTRILQINMHRSATAHESLAQFAAETKAYSALISEQYQNKDLVSWHPDISGTAAIWDRDGTILRVLTPNETMPDFRHRLDALEDAILGTDGRILVGGDFNARALE